MLHESITDLREVTILQVGLFACAQCDNCETHRKCDESFDSFDAAHPKPKKAERTTHSNRVFQDLGIGIRRRVDT